MPSRDLGILTTDASLVIRSWNEWLERATGLRAAEVVGRPLSAVAPGLESRGFVHRLEDALASGTVQVLTPAFHHYLIPCPPRGESRVFEQMQQRVTIGPLGEGGAAAGLVITIEDVTARLEQERERAGQEPGARLDAVTASLRDDDWRVRRAAVEDLSRAAQPDLFQALLDELRRNHRNFSALSSALRLFAAAEHDLTAPLTPLLGDPDPDLRMQVALALGEQRNPAAAEPLIAALEDPDPNVRFHAIEALGRLGAASAVDALVSIAESEDFFLAFAALDALALIHDPRVAARLVRLLGRPDVREAVIRMLGAVGDVQVSGPLAAVINSTPEASAAAATALTDIHARELARGAGGSQVPQVTMQVLDRSGRQHLLALLDDDASRRAALVVLGWLRDETLAPHFVRMIGRDDGGAALDALVALGDAATDHLLACCRSDDLLQPATVSALGATGQRRVTPTLVELLARGGAIGLAAAGALARIADPETFDALLAHAGVRDAALRQAVVGALNSMGHPDLPARAGKLLESDDPLLRESGVKITGYFGFAPLLPTLLALTEDASEIVRIAAIDHLPFVAVDSADLHLARRLPDETPRVRAAIVRSLAHYDTPTATGALLGAFDDPDMWVRYYAARSLSGRHTRDVADGLIRLAGSSNPEPVRIAALDALASVPGPEVDREILAACGDANADVASAALRAAGQRRTHESLAVLQEAVTGTPGPRVAAALEGLARDGSSGAVERLQWVAASTSDAATARAGIAHLGRLARGGACAAAAVDALLSLSLVAGRLEAARDALLGLPAERIGDVGHALQHPSVALRQRAVALLGELRHPVATAHLVHALSDDASDVRQAAISALERLGARHVRRRLEQMAAGDPSPAVRRTAGGALASLGDD